MKKYNSTTDFSYWTISIGIVILIAPFVMAILIPIIGYLDNLLITLGVTWYILYPAMGGTLIVIGLANRVWLGLRFNKTNHKTHTFENEIIMNDYKIRE